MNMTDTNYNLDTKEGMNNAIAWTRQLFSTVNDGGTWVVPRSMTLVRINHTDKVATLIVGPVPDPSLKRDLRQLLKLMGKDGYSYNLFLVPGSHEMLYDIKMYQPQVADTQWLGFFEVKEK